MSVVITWVDVTARYPELGKLPTGSSPEVQNNLMLMAEAAVHGILASRYSVPFSANNYTAHDLMIDTLFVQTQMSRQPKTAKIVQESLDARIKALLNGTAQMVTSAGALATTMIGDTIWSSTQNYPPTFGVSDIEKAVVSSEQLYDEAAARGEY